MKGKRRERDFIIISFFTSQYIFVFTKTLSCCVTLTIMWSLKKSNEFLELWGKSFLFP